MVTRPMGFHPDMPEQEYRDIKALSSTGLREFDDGPEYYAAYLVKPWKNTDLMRQGKALHCAFLEPETIKEKFIIVDQVKWDKGQQAKEEAGGKTALKKAQFDELEPCIANLKDHSFIKYICDENFQSEASLFWENALGIYCKCRIDMLNVEKGLSFDLKYTKKLTLKTRFEERPLDAARKIPVTEMDKHIYNNKLHWQSSFYEDGFTHVFGKAPTYTGWLFVGGTVPNIVLPVNSDYGFTELGADQYHDLLLEHIERTESGNWKSEQKVVSASAPYWAMERA